MKLTYTLVDVFTDTKLAGNQLAVFDAAGDIAPELMQRLTREINYSECTFVTGRGSVGHRVRIFTPEVELRFAGHPTLGTAALLLPREAHSGEVTLELGVGDVPVQVTRTPYGARAELLAPPAIDVGNVPPAGELAAAVGLGADALDPSLPPAVWSCGNAFALVAVRSSSDVTRARLMLPETPKGWPLGIVLYALAGNDAHARVFIPGSAVSEDPATGSANAPLVAYLHARGRVAIAEVLVTRQGIEIRRPSRLEARMVRSGDGTLRPAVAGGVVTVGSGAFEL